MQLNYTESAFTLSHKGRLVLKHSVSEPAFYLGIGEATYDMYRGNFDISDYLTQRLPLRKFTVEKAVNGYILGFAISDQDACFTLTIEETAEGRLKVAFACHNQEYNRFWVRVAADKEERVYGCGEQMSHFNLRGKTFPLWTSEPGVGRNKSTYVTWQADVKDRAGGDYYTTNYPQTTFVSDKKYFCHLQTTAYADFDFTHDNFHELQCWEMPEYLLFDSAESFPELMENLTAFFGRQPELPEWIYNGVILGIQGGTETVWNKLEAVKSAGVPVTGVWCQDWQGIKYTSFGKRLEWNWQWNSKVYPDLDKQIHVMKEAGVRFLGYINPYVLENFPLYNEAKEKGYLATREDGSDYVVDFGEFDCGVVDFTNPDACEWYKGVIQKEMIDFGLDGWMADFGEYLPTDCALANGRSAELEHNDWPRRWAKVNYEAIAERGKTDDIFFFMRAGAAGMQRYCHSLWAGDQSVDWSMDDGLASVIPAALSSGMMGNGLHHSDIGGYTTLHGMKRSKELFMRWAEMAAFTPVMRTHEGNRPGDNHQFDSDEETLKHFAAMIRLYTHLKSYMKSAVRENAAKGMPVQRPLFMHYEHDEESYDIQYQYLLGRDLLVAPVHQQGVSTWNVYLPEDQWIHVWSGRKFSGGWVEVDAPLGQPPVFYRENSAQAELLAGLRSQ